MLRTLSSKVSDLPDPPRRSDYVYIQIPKCASRSLRWALGKFLGSAANFVDFSDARDQIHRMKRPRWDSLTTFAVVRNPYDRLVSCWAWMRQEGFAIPSPSTDIIEKALGVVVYGEQMVEVENVDSLSDVDLFRCWVHAGFPSPNDAYFAIDGRRGHWAYEPQVEWLVDQEGEIAVTHLLRVESLLSDWKGLAERIGAHLEVPHLNRSEHKPVAAYFDEPTRQIAARYYRRDFELLGYS